VVANPNYDYGKQSLGSSSSGSVARKGLSQQRSGDLASLQWPQLPGTEEEGHAITQLIDAQLLMGEKATALTVQQQAAPKVLHLASHAYYMADQKKGDSNEQRSEQFGESSASKKSLQAENPLLRSGIVLAGANQPEANSKDDGYLTALEVAKLDWQGTEMVVISACESGKGDIQAGEGVYGLKRAIAVAGARSSLLSLWKVDDAATAAFMQSFYQRLKDGEGRAEALAATQQEFRQHPMGGWRHPYVWAAFQLSGDWKPVKW
jgi:CHAT domain-containing protein